MTKITTTAVALSLALIFGPLAAAADVAHAPADTRVEAHPHDAHPYMEQAMEQARDVMFYALSLVGIRYSWGGNSPQTGFDCSGLVAHVYRQIVGLILPRDSYAMARLGTPISLEDLRPGDLVFFNTMRRPFSHVGIYLGEKRFVHAPSSGKSVNVVDMTEPYWAKRYNGARRIDR
jgi:cell wall-associated NlpC family hydrolase